MGPPPVIPLASASVLLSIAPNGTNRELMPTDGSTRLGIVGCGDSDLELVQQTLARRLQALRVQLFEAAARFQPYAGRVIVEDIEPLPSWFLNLRTGEIEAVEFFSG